LGGVLPEGVLVRHFLILATLTLTACALPGASGTNSFMSAMHPTQEFCASRGLTLDAATKQCVTVPQPATPPAAPSVTGSVPQVAHQQPQPQPAPSATPAAPAQPPPQERQRAAPLMPIEPDAVIYPELSQDFDLMYELAHFVRASGYRCDSISALSPLSPLPPSRGYKLVCNRFSYKYAIEHKDGRSVVTVQ
jgi:hypothetical protein